MPTTSTSIGEDEASFESHNKAIRSEIKKPRGNQVIINDLVKRTYSMRRQDILKNGRDITDTLEKYSFFRNIDMVCL